MAQVTVFVDDAVRGDLPGLCVKEATPTSDRLVVQSLVGDGARLGVLWLLLLAGPIGWIAIAFITLGRSGRGEVLRVEVPMSDVAYERIAAARRLVQRGTLLMGAGVLVFFATAVPVSLIDDVPSWFRAWTSLALVVLGVITLAVGDRRRDQASVHSVLDASRRWVTLSQVHPTFAAACHAQEQERRPLRR